jgi:hypothetical protein
MKCTKCKEKLPKNANFCPACGELAPAETSIKVKQEIGKVRGEVVGTVLDGDALPPKLKSSTTQKVESVSKGGTVVGTVLGKDAQIGGQRQYGDNINVGDITGSTGVAIGKDNQITFRQGASANEIADAFSKLLKALEEMPTGQEKEKTTEAVQALVNEAEQGEEAEENKVQKWFSFLGEMAPDIYDVAVETFKNPLKGISMVFQKVAERAKEEKGK